MGFHDLRHIQARFQAAKPGQDIARPARILFVDDHILVIPVSDDVLSIEAVA